MIAQEKTKGNRSPLPTPTTLPTLACLNQTCSISTEKKPRDSLKEGGLSVISDFALQIFITSAEHKSVYSLPNPQILLKNSTFLNQAVWHKKSRLEVINLKYPCSQSAPLACKSSGAIHQRGVEPNEKTRAVLIRALLFCY